MQVLCSQIDEKRNEESQKFENLKIYIFKLDEKLSKISLMKILHQIYKSQIGI